VRWKKGEKEAHNRLIEMVLSRTILGCRSEVGSRLLPRLRLGQGHSLACAAYGGCKARAYLSTGHSKADVAADTWVKQVRHLSGGDDRPVRTGPLVSVRLHALEVDWSEDIERIKRSIDDEKSELATSAGEYLLDFSKAHNLLKSTKISEIMKYIQVSVRKHAF
jgi:hypothetical protein